MKNYIAAILGRTVTSRHCLSAGDDSTRELVSDEMATEVAGGASSGGTTSTTTTQKKTSKKTTKTGVGKDSNGNIILPSIPLP